MDKIDNYKRKIIFIVRGITQPRCIKRIETLQKAGFPIKVYAFNTGLYEGNIKNLPFNVSRLIDRDLKANKITKLLSFIKYFRQFYKENSPNDIYYLFGYETAIICYFLGFKNFVYEEADISATRIKNKILRSLNEFIDKRVIKKSIYTIFTSLGFTRYYFKNTCPSNIIYLPNKLNSYFNDVEKKNAVKSTIINPEKIKFGFIGLIRYKETIVRFAKVVGKYFPQHEFHFFGDEERKGTYIDEEIRSYKNVFLHGPFQNPTDLPQIYSQIDINIVCYDTTSGNVRIAEPNKLYESIYFETPIVVSSNTFLAERVKELGVGIDINAGNDECIKEFINNINADNINLIIEKMKKIGYKELVDDSTEFVNKMSMILNHKNK